MNGRQQSSFTQLVHTWKNIKIMHYSILNKTLVHISANLYLAEHKSTDMQYMAIVGIA